MIEWIQENFLIPMAAGVIALIIASVEKKFLKEDDELRELREKQLSTAYGPLKMLLVKYDTEMLGRQELINAMQDIWNNYYLFLDNSLNQCIVEIISSAPDADLKSKLYKIKREVESKYNYLRKKVNYEIGIVDYRNKIDYNSDVLLFVIGIAVIIVAFLWVTGASNDIIIIVVAIALICAFIFSVRLIWYFLRMAFDRIKKKY